MPKNELEADLQDGFVPISKAAASIAAMIKRSHQRRQPVIITQKGYPVAALLSVDLYLSLRERATRAGEAAEGQLVSSAFDAVDLGDAEQLQGEDAAVAQSVA